jgi:hypothetical protein
MDNHIGCLSVEVFKIGHDADASCFNICTRGEAEAYLFSNRPSIETFRIGTSIKADAYRIGDKLIVNCFQVCSINKDTNCWKWDAGEIMYWDNNEIIALEWE